MRPRNSHSDVEAALRRWRPSADAEFARELARQFHAADREGRARHRRRWQLPTPRSLVATGLTAALLAALAGFGELGYAASGVDRAVSEIASAIHIGKHSGPAHSPSAGAAADQYHKPKTCHEKMKQRYDAKVAAARRAYRARVAAAARARDAALRKCATRACRLAARAKYASEVGAAARARDQEMARQHRVYLHVVHRCRH